MIKTPCGKNARLISNVHLEHDTRKFYKNFTPRFFQKGPIIWHTVNCISKPKKSLKKDLQLPKNYPNFATKNK